MLGVGIRLTFDAAHRLPDYKGKCWHLHGHTYILEAVFARLVRSGNKTATVREGPLCGMVADFADLKAIVKAVVDEWDHAALLRRDDTLVRVPEDMHVVYLDDQPTVEVMCQLLAVKIGSRVSVIDARLYSLRLYETPNCWADFVPSVEI